MSAAEKEAIDFMCYRAKQRYETVKAGEWVQPVRKGYRMQCCDCGLVHVLDFMVIHTGRGATIKFRARRLSQMKRRRT